jgi:hypothetical protein
MSQMREARNRSDASSEGLASQDGERGDKNFLRNVERAPELVVVGAQRVCVAPQSVDRRACVRRVCALRLVASLLENR